MAYYIHVNINNHAQVFCEGKLGISGNRIECSIVLEILDLKHANEVIDDVST